MQTRAVCGVYERARRTAPPENPLQSGLNEASARREAENFRNLRLFQDFAATFCGIEFVPHSPYGGPGY